MYHTVAVDVIQGVADGDGDGARPLHRKSAVLGDQFSQQAALHPLHHHVDLAGLASVQHLHHPGMIQPFADFDLALETVEKDRVRLHIRMGDLDGDRAAVAHVGGAIDGGHSTPRNQFLDMIVAELAAGTR